MLISIIISCSKNKVRHFARAINSIYYQHADFSAVELLFLNDGAEAELFEILKQYRGKFHIRYFWIEKPFSSVNHVATRRNFLVRRARGKYILITDPEIVHCSETLSQVTGAFVKYGDKIWYCGKVLGAPSLISGTGALQNFIIDTIDPDELGLLGPAPHPNTPLDTQRYQNRDFFNKLNPRIFKPIMFCTALNKNLFEKVLGYNENLLVWGHEEEDLYDRLARRGIKRVYDNNFIVCHLPHRTGLTANERLAWDVYNSCRPFTNTKTWGQLRTEEIKELRL